MKKEYKQWEGFSGKKWKENIDVSDFIFSNYTPYEGDERFLCGITDRTKKLKEKIDNLMQKERNAGGVLSIDTDNVMSLTTFGPGYIDKENEIIFGLQTDEPLKRGLNPFGGMRMMRSACEAYGYKVSDKVENEFKYRTTHNDGVFRVYTDEMRKVRRSGVITGLPDAYGRGRIIGDYRRVVLYGVDRLIEEKKKDKNLLGKK